MNISSSIFSKNKDSLHEPALKINEHTISYKELFDKALIIASFLVNNGASNETIGIVGQRKFSSYIGLLGILFSGCSFTPINPKYNKTRINSMIKSSNIRFLVGDSSDIEKLDKDILSGMHLLIAPFSPQSDLSNCKWIHQNTITNFDLLEFPVSRNDEDLAYINYTSGSTGTPKGVKVSHLNVGTFISNMSTFYPLPIGFRASQTFDLSFDPSVSDILFTWYMTGILCVLPEKEMLVPSEFITREKITFWNSVPSIANFMMKTGNLEENSFPELTHSMFCGEQFPVHIAKAWRKAAPNSTIENLYGPTEATIYITRYVYKKEDEKKEFKNNIVPIGKPFNSHEFALLDENNIPLKKDGKGEIIFSGPQITQGYLNNEIKSNDVFVKLDWDNSNKIWYKTGDLGFINIDGNLECTGRKDNQIKLAGRRIEIGEIESALSQFPQTEGSVVVPLRDNQDIIVGCVAFTIQEITKEDILNIRSKIKDSLDTVFFPKKIISINDFPKALSGKINRKELEAMAKED
jgi:amino acid adenylation domain-containing protein